MKYLVPAAGAVLTAWVFLSFPAPTTSVFAADAPELARQQRLERVITSKVFQDIQHDRVERPYVARHFGAPKSAPIAHAPSELRNSLPEVTTPRSFYRLTQRDTKAPRLHHDAAERAHHHHHHQAN